ncbi:LysM peptidoglycan-binding domain-containing protein [Streptacidiphilus fuscans]|uniref:LysM peptidoglycan-binding domain-containing protein n=1 Tax=Streptacidiphilus fuscans TaxID=2789292 RepID=A0A931B543_9ACTN|nr:LysM peptidoglycan-binding domain-containing protein [Streptacidiphilus fuscans]MBF9069166.1 LysM peptidoglycan-binding domain-containing protein [Streptacidiphilus fuscans]
MSASSHGRHAKPRTSTIGRAAATTAIGAAAAASAIGSATAAQAATTPAGTTPVTSYTVQSGDTLSGIAVKDHVPGGYQAIASLNHIASPYVLKPGEKLVLPAGSYISNPSTPAPASPFPVAVNVGNATQVITVHARSDADATVQLWQKTGSTWTNIYTTIYARIGANGITNGATRVQGTDTTPTGTYTITQGFGVGVNPGTKMPYHQVTTHDWWVEDPTSAYYNQMRTDTQGGFHLTEQGADGSEHLINYPTQYHNALVINFNMDPAVHGRGAGIFLHDLGPEAGPTAGCVAVPATTMNDIMRWIDPAQNPVIAIG